MRFFFPKVGFSQYTCFSNKVVIDCFQTGVILEAILRSTAPLWREAKSKPRVFYCFWGRQNALTPIKVILNLAVRQLLNN